MSKRDRPRPVAAIDASLTGFHLMIEGPDMELISRPLYTKADEWPKTLQGRMDRMRSIAETTRDLIRKHWPVLLLIEGYAFSRGGKSSSVVTLGELGGLLRDRCVGYADDSVEVPPGTVKKFATGKGNANKVEVATNMAMRFGRSFKDDNESDCFAVLKLGQVVVGYEEPKTQFQRDAADVVRALIRKETQT